MKPQEDTEYFHLKNQKEALERSILDKEICRLTRERDEARRKLQQAMEVFSIAGRVMKSLQKHGPSIVPHLLDTDDNDGQRLRVALSALAPATKEGKA